MTIRDDAGIGRWYSVYVPPVDRAASGTTPALRTYNKTYFRLGSPDVVTEAALRTGLEVDFGVPSTDPGVAAAFGDVERAGSVLYTEGDVVQFVNGRVDTRVLNDSFVVHVLNKADVAAAERTASGSPVPKTYRSYLRLGKPHAAIETALAPVVAPAVLRAHVEALLIEDAGALPETAGGAEAVLAEAAVVPQSASPQWVAGTRLEENGTNGDKAAIGQIDNVRSTTDPRGAFPYKNSATARIWALAALRGLHTTLATVLAGRAADECRAPPPAAGQPATPTTARERMEARVGVDPVARAQLKVLATSAEPSVSQWARRVMGRIKEEVPPAKFSLGNGISMFSDDPIAITTPSAMKVTVGSDSRTVLGETFTKTYDVSDETLTKIRLGEIKTENEMPDRKLVTASLTQRSSPHWRTIKFDKAKAISFNVNDTGTFALSSSYTFSVGTKFTNGLSASLDAAPGISVSMPLAFKVELNEKQTKTSFYGIECNYKDSQDLRGRSLSLTTDLVQTAVQPMFATFSTGMRAAMLAVNAVSLLYTAAVAGVADHDEEEIRKMLEAAEEVYITVNVLNAAALAASVVAGVIQLLGKKAADRAAKTAPVQPANVEINSGGIKLQCGASYIAIDATGVVISGPQLWASAPQFQIVPQYIPGNVTPAGIVAAMQLAQDSDLGLMAVVLGG